MYAYDPQLSIQLAKTHPELFEMRACYNNVYNICGNCPRHANRIDIAIIKTRSSKVQAVISKRWGTTKLWCKISK